MHVLRVWAEEGPKAEILCYEGGEGGEEGSVSGGCGGVGGEGGGGGGRAMIVFGDSFMGRRGAGRCICICR